MTLDDRAAASDPLPRSERPAAPVVVRPRTIGALGAPEPLPPAEPWLSPPLESLAGAPWDPPTAPVPAVDLEAVLTDPDIFSLEPEELAIVAEADDPLVALEILEAGAISEPPAGADERGPDDEPGQIGTLTNDPAHEAVERQAASGGGLLRANLVVASGTAVSRLTGLVRTSLILVALGKGLNDAYIGANNTPNMIYELILGGILTAALVPLFTDDMERGDGQDGTSAIISFALVALVVVSLLALVAGPALIHLFATGSPDASRDDYISVGVPLSLLFAPQVFFYGLMAVWSAVLNSRHRFLAAAWAPVLNNVIAIATLVLAARVAADTPTLRDALADRRIIAILGVGTTLGIATMALSLYPAIRRSGVRLHFKLRMKHPAVRRAIRLSGWTFGYVIANLIAVVVISILAHPSTGDPARYTTAYQFFQLPHALLAVSIMVTFEPLLGRADSRGDRREFNRQLLLGFRLIGLLIIPAAVGYLALPKGLDARTFTATGELGTALGLSSIIAAFAIGLPGFSTYLYALRGFYAMKDTRVPFIINCVENAINIATAIVFARWWGVVGLALSFSLAYTVSAGIAIVVLARRSTGFDWGGLVGTWVKLLIAAGIMGGFVYGLVTFLAPASALALIPTVIAGIVVGAITYFASIYALRVPGIDQLMTRLPGLRRFA
ncbi:MAG: murein biosynthesis integral rane protein MurJ [Ilumatobacteraceae bacterium]|nr:murein biosynthesis integral rane protein MurJ [Ilumatobacteraceae bacterium]